MLVYDQLGTARCEIADPEKDLLFRGDGYSLYLATDPTDEKTGFLRLPRDRLGNAKMQLEVEKLQFMANASEEFERAYQTLGNDPNARIHYAWLFPKLEYSFICDESQGKRQANFLTAVDAELKDFFPFPRLTAKYKVDAKTGAWILGRFYKLQAFADAVDLSFNFYSDQVVIEPRFHRMIYLGWNLDKKQDDWYWNNIARMTKCIVDFIEPDNSRETQGFLFSLIPLTEEFGTKGEEAHRWLYTTIEGLWGHKYHPFTYFDRSSNTWHSLTDAEIPKP